MGRLVDDLNRLSAAAAEGKVLLGAGQKPSVAADGWRIKARAIPKHDSASCFDQFYDHVREIGRGSFSKVSLARERRSGHERVRKVVDLSALPDEALRLTRAEVDVLCALDHPSVVRLYEYSEDPVQQKLVLMLEHIPGGDCSGMLEEVGHSLAEGRVSRLVRQLLAAVGHCHARGVVHRDIKPQNMMLTGSLGVWGCPDLKLIDFGLAARMHASRDFVGTPAYMAPEVVEGTAEYTSQADLWSIGCTLVELLTGAPPFGRPEDEVCGGGLDGGMEVVFGRIRDYRTFTDLSEVLAALPGWTSRSAEVQDLVERLLRKDPVKRLTARQSLNHPWVVAHWPPAAGLSAEIAHSLAKYARQPLAVRRCAFLIAARTPAAEDARIGAAFCDANPSGSGTISREELVHSLATGAPMCGWGRPLEVDASSVMAAADLTGSGGIGFTEFAAACVFGRHSREVSELGRLCFNALDQNRTGSVSWAEAAAVLGGDVVAECRAHAGDQAAGPSAEAWASCLESVAAAAARGDRDGNAAVPTPAARHPLLRLLRGLMCDQSMLLCSTCEQPRDEGDESAATADAPAVFRGELCSRGRCLYESDEVPTPAAKYTVPGLAVSLSPTRFVRDAGKTCHRPALDIEVVRCGQAARRAHGSWNTVPPPAG